MKVILEPQVPATPKEVEYAANGDKLIVTLNGVAEEFDFTGTPDGYTADIKADVLETNPVLYAKRSNGNLTVTVIDYIKPEPVRQEIVTGVDADGNDITALEEESDFQIRLSEWKHSKTIRQITL